MFNMINYDFKIWVRSSHLRRPFTDLPTLCKFLLSEFSLTLQLCKLCPFRQDLILALLHDVKSARFEEVSA